MFNPQLPANKIIPSPLPFAKWTQHGKSQYSKYMVTTGNLEFRNCVLWTVGVRLQGDWGCKCEITLLPKSAPLYLIIKNEGARVNMILYKIEIYNFYNTIDTVSMVITQSRLGWNASYS